MIPPDSAHAELTAVFEYFHNSNPQLACQRTPSETMPATTSYC